MATPVIMPKVDMDQASGTVVEWLKKDGEAVKQGEIILIIETDKVSIEVESQGSGILRGITASPGDIVPIATTIAYILQPGESLPQGATTAVSGEPALPPAPMTTPAKATPLARKMAAASGADLSGIAGSGPRGRVTKADVESVISSAPVSTGNGKHQRARDGKANATPAARRIAREHGVDLLNIGGSGPSGRIQSADVLSYSPHPTAGLSPFEPAHPAPEVEIVPLVGMRRTIAERMLVSYQSIPHITFTSRVDMTCFNRLRVEFNAHAEALGAGRVSVTAMLVRIVATALARHPWLNSSLRGEEIHLRKDINLGVAVALEAGLIVPVVHNADRKGIGAIAAEVDDLVARARDGKLVPSDVSGGTFTLSNLGPFGVEQFTALINPPQAGILAVGVTQMEAIPDTDGRVRAVPVIRMTLSADHRVVDGAVAARFVADLKKMLENPALLLW